MNRLSLRNNQPVEVQDCRRISGRYRGIYGRICPNFIKENRRLSSTCNRLDVQTRGSQPITYACPKISPVTVRDDEVNEPILSYLHNVLEREIIMGSDRWFLLGVIN